MSNGELKQIRSDFYKRMRDTYNTTNEEIVRILKRRGYGGFRRDEVKLYENAIFGELGPKKKEVKNPLGLTKEYYPCPIPACTGVKIYMDGGTKRWECSAGGWGHYLAWHEAHRWKRHYPNTGISVEKKASMMVYRMTQI